MTGHTEATGTGRDALAAVERVLRENGLSDNPGQFDSNIHSWRCEYPDHYGPCDCFAELVTDLAAVVAEAERKGAEKALRDAADDVPRAPGDALSVRDWLRARADRHAAGGEQP